MKTMRRVLRTLLVLFAATAVVSGIISLVNPGSINGDTTPFKSTGVLLALIVGAANLYAAISNIKKRPNRYDWAITGGIAIALWVVIQMLWAGTVNWLQLLYLTSAMMVILMAFQLKGKWIV